MILRHAQEVARVGRRGHAEEVEQPAERRLHVGDQVFVAELHVALVAEARAGGAHLGLESYEFWGYPEGHLPGPRELQEAARRLALRVEELGVDTVYSPWVGEHHVDHHVLARTARLALALCNFRGTAWGYEVWTPLVPSIVVDVTSVHERKVAALREHRSQLAYHDLRVKGLALSAQRAMYLAPEATHGEAFAPLGEPSAADRELLGT